jgi:hypothetical protein
MNSTVRYLAVLGLLAVLVTAGCNSPYHADRLALAGGLLGGGTGAIIGDALGNTGAGTAIGAGVGALAGAAVGDSMDEMEARNRAMIASQLGREVRPGAVTIEDVIMMSQAGVDDELIIRHIRANGMARVPGPNELISLTQQGVSTSVVRAMQEPPPPARREAVVVQEPSPRPVIVEEYHYGPGWYTPPPYYYYRHRPPRPRVGWGFSYHSR